VSDHVVADQSFRKVAGHHGSAEARTNRPSRASLAHRWSFSASNVAWTQRFRRWQADRLQVFHSLHPPTIVVRPGGRLVGSTRAPPSTSGLARGLRQVAAPGQRWRPDRNSCSASAVTKHPEAPDVLYVEAVGGALSPSTASPPRHLKAFPRTREGGRIDAERPRRRGAIFGGIRHRGDRPGLGRRGQRDGADAFDESWKRLLASIERKT